MLWKGPKEDGITYSITSRFMADDPYRNYLYFGLGQEEYKELEPNLAYGDTGHYGLEHLIEIPHTIPDFTEDDWELVNAAMEHKLANEYPEANPSFIHSLKRLIPLYDDSFKEIYGRFITELDFKVPYTTRSGLEVTLRGKIDALNIVPGTKENLSPTCRLGDRELSKIPDGFIPGPVIGEHKFKGKIDAAQHLKEIPVDLQVAIYCYASGARRVVYDNIRIPDTQWSLPPRRSRQTLKSWINELYDSKSWGDFPVTQKRGKWFCQHDLPITDEQINETFAFTLDPVIEQIYEWWEHCRQPGFDHTDPKFYGPKFWRKPPRLFDGTQTQKFECNYYGLITKQITYDELIPVKGFYVELPE